ncbi:MAG: hypothetical protein GEU82_10890 [Luteitalea sp.]|nr:hypothetical protein [Luteitalea sp.]
MRKFPYLPVAVCSLALAMACSKQSPSPASPTSTRPVDASANADGSKLKSSPPVPQAPVNNARPEGPQVTLSVVNAGVKFGPGEGVQFTYRFQVYNGANVLVYQSLVGSGVGTTSHTITSPLEGDQAYSWQARVEFQGETGPWSPRATFIAPQNGGYIRGDELYDPLINGRTEGVEHGPLTFVPGRGVRLESQASYISYQLENTLTEGEFSLLVTDMPTNTDGDKTKLFGMAQGYDDIVTNDRRMTVEKRGNPAGVIAWRFISHGDQIDTEGAEREQVEFDQNQTYFFRATWRNNFFNLEIREGGVGGSRIYSKGKPFEGRAYDPNPHVIYVGAPVGRSGIGGASVDHVTIRHVWVSGRERPPFANQ